MLGAAIVIVGAAMDTYGTATFTSGTFTDKVGAAILKVAFPTLFTPIFPPTEMFGAATFKLIDGIETFGASMLRLGAAMLTSAFQ